MTNFIPIFPLELVVYPGEHVNLHIFEDRYKELINECAESKRPFGIPAVVKSRVEEHGTLMQVVEISERFDDGRMNIKTMGLQVFRVLEIIKEIPGKMYSGAIVNYPDNDETHNRQMIQQVVNAIRELHKLLKVEKDFKKPDEELLSYDIAHHAGLTMEEEYELLGLFREEQRLEYLKRHLTKVIPFVAGAESIKQKIKLNGHFKELKGFNLDF